MNLVEGEDRRGRVVDRRGKPLGGDIDDDPKSERRVLLHGPFSPRGRWIDRGIVGNAGAAVDAEQRIARRHEVANLRDHLDDAVVTGAEATRPCLSKARTTPGWSRRATAPRRAALVDCSRNSGRLRWDLTPPGGSLQSPGIDVINDLRLRSRGHEQGAARPQHPADAVDQVEEQPQARGRL